MAVEHMVWIRFKDGVSEDRAAHHMRELMGLAESVPAIQSIRAGRNFTDRAGDFTHGLTVTPGTLKSPKPCVKTRPR
jgi:hypothetical protein